MDRTMTGTALDGLWEFFLELSSRIEGGVIGIDDALLELQGREVVDAAGYAWRIDPMTRTFIRRAPGGGSGWKAADPARFAEQGEQAENEWPPKVRESVPATTPWQERWVDVACRTPRWARYAAATGAAAILVGGMIGLTGTGGGDEQHPRSTASAAPSHQAAPPARSSKRARAGVLPGPPAVPTSDECYNVLVEMTSGSLERIAKVTRRSQYNAENQALYAATFTGWVNAGLTIKQRRPIGDSSGLSATQVWELRSSSTVVAVAGVTWKRTDPQSPWLLARWPEFHPAN